MKKKFILVCFIVFNLVQSQDLKGLKIGVNGGIPLRDSKEFFTFNGGLDLAFVHQINDFGIGITTGFSFYKTKTDDNTIVINGINDENFNVIPLGLVMQFSITEKFFVGTDLGFAFFLTQTGTNGGAYIQPKLGFQREKFEIYLGYKKLSQTGGGTSIETVNLGVNYKFK